MPVQLSEVEARILGSLVEKAITTPDLYPLTFNSLLSACNQKTSRDPVMALDQDSLGKGLQSLIQKGLAERVHEPGSRVPKFRHHFGNVVDGDDPRQVGALCVLLLRGAQTPGEIKTRADRLCSFSGTAEVESLLQELGSRADGPLVARLPRQPGQKEPRFRHLLCAAEPRPSGGPAPGDRLGELARRVEGLEARLRALEDRLSRTS